MDPAAANNDPVFAHDVFISYSRKNEAFAGELQRALESYKPPRDLDAPQRFLNTFRDKKDFEAGDYSQRLEGHLKAAKKLIVVCTPEARKSIFVNDEVRRFARWRGAEHIIPVLYAGVPNNEAKAEQEAELAFPSALCEVMDIPLAVNYLDFKVGRDKISKGVFADAWFMVLANVYDASRSLVEQREKRRRVRTRRIAFGVLSASVMVLSVLLVFALFSRRQALAATVEAEKQRNEATAARAVAETQRNDAVTARNEAEEQRKKAVQAAEDERKAAEREKLAKEEEQKQRRNAERATVRAQAAEQQAIRERDEARRQALASASYALAERDPTLALRLAEKVGYENLNVSAGLAITKAFNTGSWFYSHRFQEYSDADISRDGNRRAWIDDQKILHLEELSSGARTQRPTTAQHVRFLPQGNLLLWGYGLPLELADPQGTRIADHKFEIAWNTPIVCPSGEVMVLATDGEQNLVVHRIDPGTGEETEIRLPDSGKGLRGRFACLPDGSGLALVASYPNRVLVGDVRGNQQTIPLPESYDPGGIDIQPGKRRLAVYLYSNREVRPDALAWVQLDENWGRASEVKVVSLQMRSTDVWPGMLRFLPNGRAVAVSVDGWARLVDLDKGESSLIDRNYGRTDEIAVSRNSGLFVIARRSGGASVYNSEGAMVGRLLGEEVSTHQPLLGDPTFYSVSFDDAGEKIITVTRDSARIWHRPRHELSPDGDAPGPSLAAMRGRTDLEIKACRRGEDIGPVISDKGELSLCVKALGRTDHLRTGLSVEQFFFNGADAIAATAVRVRNGCSVGPCSASNRLFILSPRQILDHMQEESRLGRLWQPDPDTLNELTGLGPLR